MRKISVRLMGSDGPFARVVEGYNGRPMQLEMAQAIAKAIVRCETLVAEAGTGTGKTFAYLVPALMWGGQCHHFDRTRNLQDQLFLRDIPTVRKALVSPVTVALLKGRSNYVCHLHLARTAEYGRMATKADTVYLREIVKFAKMTDTGDKSDLASVPETASIWGLVTSTKENCPGMECPHYQDCFVMKARKAAAAGGRCRCEPSSVFRRSGFERHRGCGTFADGEYGCFRRGAPVARYGDDVFRRIFLDKPDS